MTGIVYTCLHTNQSRSYLNHLVYKTIPYLHTYRVTGMAGLKVHLFVYHISVSKLYVSDVVFLISNKN